MRTYGSVKLGFFFRSSSLSDDICRSSSSSLLNEEIKNIIIICLYKVNIVISTYEVLLSRSVLIVSVTTFGGSSTCKAENEKKKCLETIYTRLNY